VIEGNEMWRIIEVNNRFGFVIINERPMHIGNYIPGVTVVGTQSVRTILGSYRGSILSIYITHVDAFWAFDENSQLIDIQVGK